jgi:3-oxoadipate CoA-transferase, beta subunit
MNDLQHQRLARRVARDIPDGSYVNLGIGLPTLVADYVPDDIEIAIQSENGILGVGPKPAPEFSDPELINAGKQQVTLTRGASLFDHATSFMMIRGGHLDIAIMGAYEVSANGDLANWTTGKPGLAPAVGGAMDLAVGAKRVWVMMEHCTRDGAPRLLASCTYPLTAAGIVTRIYSDLAVIDVDGGFVVRDLLEDISFEDLQQRTGAPLRRASG